MSQRDSVISYANSTLTPLGSGETFTGLAEHSYHNDVLVTCKSSSDGTLYVDFSVDAGDNWDTQIPFVVSAGVGEFHTIVKGPRHCRVRFVNGSDAQTYLRLQTAFGTFRQANSALSTPVQKDSDAAITKSVDPYLLIMQGLFSDYSIDAKFGRNNDIDGPEDIWNGGGDYTGFPTGAAETVQVFSSDAADTNGGTGAWTVELIGLDANFDQQTEIVTLSGTTPVLSANTYKRLNRARVLTAGTGGVNAGTITIRHSSTTANIFAVMPIGNNQTAICCWTVPRGYTAYIKRVHVAGGRLTSTTIADFSFRIREPGSVFRANRLFTAGNYTVVNITYVGGIRVPEMSDVKIRCDSISASNGDFAAEFAYVLVKN